MEDKILHNTCLPFSLSVAPKQCPRSFFKTQRCTLLFILSVSADKNPYCASLNETVNLLGIPDVFFCNTISKNKSSVHIKQQICRYKYICGRPMSAHIVSQLINWLGSYINTWLCNFSQQISAVLFCLITFL